MRVLKKVMKPDNMNIVSKQSSQTFFKDDRTILRIILLSCVQVVLFLAHLRSLGTVETMYTAVNYFHLWIKMDVKFVDFSLKCILTSKMWNKSRKIGIQPVLAKA